MPGEKRRKQTDSRFARKERVKTFCTYFRWQTRFVHVRILHYIEGPFLAICFENIGRAPLKFIYLPQNYINVFFLSVMRFNMM